MSHGKSRKSISEKVLENFLGSERKTDRAHEKKKKKLQKISDKERGEDPQAGGSGVRRVGVKSDRGRRKKECASQRKGKKDRNVQGEHLGSNCKETFPNEQSGRRLFCC